MEGGGRACAMATQGGSLVIMWRMLLVCVQYSQKSGFNIEMLGPKQGISK